MTADRGEFAEGVRHSLPFILSVLPFGMVVGTLGVANGGGIGDVILQSLLMFAGASQTVMWELYPAGNPVWVVAIAVFAVNFRLMLYSAAIGRKLEPISRPRMLGALYLLQDISLAVGLQRAERPKGLSWHYYMGLSIVLFLVWQVATIVGAVFGSFIEEPRDVGLDMLVPIYFLCLTMGFRAKPNAAIIFATSVAVAAAAWLTIGSPYHIGFGGLAGMVVAALLARPREVAGG